MLAEKFKHHTVILASGSPRRQELLRGLDIDFDIETRPVNEVYPDHLKGHEITDHLAKLKASAFENLAENEILITSDTIVWLNDKAMNKPRDIAFAKAQLQALSGSTHEVITSVCFTTHQRQQTIYDITEVQFKNLSTEEIDYYLDRYKPMDKAGAYGVQEWIGFIGVEKLTGSYFNVMGFPLHKVYEVLKQW
jgi:septum formation protein